MALRNETRLNLLLYQNKKSLVFLILLSLYRVTQYFGIILERMVAPMLKHGTPLVL